MTLDMIWLSTFLWWFYLEFLWSNSRKMWWI